MKHLFTVLLSCLLTLVSVQSILAQSPAFSVQGVLRDPQGRSVDDGTYEVTFKLYTVATGGAALWTETQPSVQVTHGVFSVKLGSVTSLPTLGLSLTYWLGLTVVGGSELSPRFEMMRSFSALTAYSMVGDSNVFYGHGKVGIGTLNPSANAKLEVNGNLKMTAGSNSKIIFSDGTELTSAQTGSAGTLTNTSDALIKSDNDANGSGNILFNTGNNERMRITNNGTIAIGTTTPPATAKLVIGGSSAAEGLDLSTSDQYANIRVLRNSLNATDKDMYIGYQSGATSSLHLYSNNSETMTLKGTNVSIGTTDPAGYKLNVNGAIRGTTLTNGGMDFSLGTDDQVSRGNTGVSRALVKTSGASLTLNYAGDFTGGVKVDGANGITSQAYFLDNATTGVVHNGDVGRYGQAALFDFGAAGVLIENGTGESGGFFANGDNATIWSAGDGDVLLAVYDEDGPMALRWKVDGDGDAFKVSDRSLKENISPLTNSLDRILKLRGVDYTMKRTESEKEKIAAGTMKVQKTKNIGFIAQEIEEVLPEVVSTDEQSGLKSVSYEMVIPLLVEATKELNRQISEIKSENEKLKTELAKLAEQIKK